MQNVKLKIYTDGGAVNNPGPAGIGVVIINEKSNKRYEYSKYIGEATNNEAEYQALVLALEKARALGANDVECYLDSELLVNQLNRKFKVKDKDLAPLFVKVWNLTLDFKKVKFIQIPREKNRDADLLAERAIKTNI